MTPRDAVAVTRAIAHTALLSCAVLVAGFSAWLLVVPAALVVGGIAAGVVTGRRPGDSRLGRLGRASAALVRSPWFGVRVVGLTAAATCARVAAATAVAASLGIGAPLNAGLLVTAALVLSAALPLTPGSIGITSGAISIVLVQQGVPLPTAVAAGVLFHALESAVSVTLGLFAAPVVARPRLLQGRGVQVAFVGGIVIAATMLGGALLASSYS